MAGPVNLYLIVKQRDRRGKWERTGKGTEDAYLEKGPAEDRVRQYKNNVPTWNFGYAHYVDGKLVDILGL